MSKSSKSAQGLSLNTMIIGAIVLIVLMVLVGAFGGFFGNKFTPEFKKSTEKDCTGTGYKPMPSECAPDPTTGFNYEQVYAKFAEGALEQGEVCCKSSCEALKGRCDTMNNCASGSRLPNGDTGCSSGKVCCK